eukprot:CAMPEP_0113953874 /NCGR_PEP_ID=MMETSP0011_2-20120614/98_1 /TAXON_ID=101924 /ORGANISM="Rhodosorus marinus" /LENGTH=55 /DNA_ID=CAMNT_0000962657 /DNA_START=1356 /DNA_END=1523 /DNA_ORIENTATION=- /assembly_acc=CAM_ASM_000156
MSCPMSGMALARLVMTVAPHSDIWPQGSTYPRKAVSIELSSMALPQIHVLVLGFM